MAQDCVKAEMLGSLFHRHLYTNNNNWLELVWD